MTTTIQQCTKKYFDTNFHKYGQYERKGNIYNQYIVSKDVFEQLCPKEYQDDTLALRATTDRVLIFNKITTDRLTLICV